MEIFLLCLMVFFCRVLDVSLGTMRTICTVKGKTWLATLIGFIEVLIWFLVVKEALNGDAGGIYVAVAYAGGYATGTFVGGKVAKAIIPVKLEVQVITSTRDDKILELLTNNGYAATVSEVFGAKDKTEKYMLYIDIDSRQLKTLQKIILEFDQNAFISTNEANKFVNGYFAKPNQKRK